MSARCRAALCLLAIWGAPAWSAGEDTAWFADRSRATGLDFVHWNGMSGRLYYVEVVGAGGALFDYDQDGDLDLYLVQGALLGGDRTPADALFPWPGPGEPLDRLLRNDLEVAGAERRVRWVDVTGTSGISAPEYGMGAAVGDIDNDGLPDLYVLNFGRNQLWRNRGGGRFEEVGGRAGVDDERWSVSASFTDFDGDGWLDLYVVNYLDYSFIAHKTCLTERGEPDYCLPSAYRPAASRLYHNRGDGTFEDWSERAGIAAASANGLGVVSGDFDGDGRVDFYVANDLMPNFLWLNRGRDAGGVWRFVEEGLVSGAALNKEGRAEASMGVTAGDVDGDLDLDLFMTHFRREHNTLYLGDGKGFFDEVTERFDLAAPSWEHTAFGTGFLDYDNDGWLDLVAANGAVTFPPGGDRTRNPFPLDERSQLFRNLEGKRFADVSAAAGAAFAESHVGRGTLLGDVDNDGDTDLVITNNSGPARLLINQIGERAPWLGLRLRSERRDALGAVVTLERAGAPPLLRRAHSDGGYAGANDPRVLFGLGGGAELVRLEVRWPSGRRERFPPPAAGAYHTLVEGSGEALPP